MTFTVTYRGADGAVCEECVEAAGRRECFAQMRARGIAPISVKEGASGRGKAPAARAPNVGGVARPVAADGRPMAKSTSISCKVFLVAGLALAIIGGGLWWRTTHSMNAPCQKPESSTKRVALPKEVNPATNPAPKLVADPIEKMTDIAEPTGVQPEIYMGKRVIKRVETTNATGRVKAVLTTEDGLTHRVYVHVPGNDRIILKRGTDHVLAAVLSVPPGTDAPPVPLDEGMEAEFLESLKEPIEDLETDTPEERRIKELVRQGREDMKTLMDQGMSFRQVILEHQARAKENSIIRLKIIQEAARIREKHGEEEEATYRKTMNAALERMGILPVGDGRPRTRPYAQQTEP